MTKTLPFGPVMIDIEGTTLSDYDKDKIAHPNTGAIILFARNYESPQQITALTADIRQSRQGDILIAVDQEGGRVQRFQHGFTRLPPAAVYAAHPNLAESAGWLMAVELLSVGIDFSFAPVLDVDCGISDIIGNRSFSRDENQVIQLASAFCQGMRAAGMAATGKHFPGHGGVALDSHLDLPIDQRSFEEIKHKDLLPFQRLIQQGLQAIMPAHVVYPAIDELPAGFSSHWIQTILRQQLGFEGTVFSDDLSMEGAASAGDFKQRAALALQAGCDMVLVCNHPKAADQVLDSIPIQASDSRQFRLSRMSGKQGVNRQALLSNAHWQKVSQQITHLT